MDYIGECLLAHNISIPLQSEVGYNNKNLISDTVNAMLLGVRFLAKYLT